MLIDSVFDFFFLVDIIINFHTTYVGYEGWWPNNDFWQNFND